MSEPTPEPCGCRVKYESMTKAKTGWGAQPAGIIYCSAHAAAPDLAPPSPKPRRTPMSERPGTVSWAAAEIDRLRKQNADLLAALEEIVGYDVPTLKHTEISRMMMQDARAALSRAKEGES